MSEVSEGSNLDPILLNIVVGHLHDEIECSIAESGYEKENEVAQQLLKCRIIMQINLVLWG